MENLLEEIRIDIKEGKNLESHIHNLTEMIKSEEHYGILNPSNEIVSDITELRKLRMHATFRLISEMDDFTGTISSMFRYYSENLDDIKENVNEGLHSEFNERILILLMDYYIFRGGENLNFLNRIQSLLKVLRNN
ncbi:hypothetical protein [Emticicia sp. BO119]|uniref:hypothetical protein n=1 Tax=Emticicia sp. BO119 TaxID=2757768 RepID=UPI0015EFE720|nr:hypothetical protein [Emticicia sp. BO119]MBA4851386.1 hypothetical protein [Emticicia sp. BO119]